MEEGREASEPRGGLGAADLAHPALLAALLAVFICCGDAREGRVGGVADAGVPGDAGADALTPGAVWCWGVVCDDGNPCTEAFCRPDGDCGFEDRPDGVGCTTDGDPCTWDACFGGACLHGPMHQLPYLDGDFLDFRLLADGHTALVESAGYQYGIEPAVLHRVDAVADIVSGHPVQPGRAMDGRVARALADGGAVVAGYVRPETWLEEVRLVRLAADGQVLWQRVLAEAMAEPGVVQIEEGADGTMVVVGDVGDRDPGGVWLEHIDREGERIWIEIIAVAGTTPGGVGGGPPYSNEATDVAALADGGFALAGGTPSAYAHWESVRPWVVRLDADGHALWTNVFDGANDEQGGVLAEAPDGDILWFGIVERADRRDGELWDRGVFRRLSPAGDLVEERIHAWTAATSVAHTSDAITREGGGLVVAGSRRVQVGTTTRTALWMLAMDREGDLLWEWDLSSERYPLWAARLRPLPEGGHVVLANTPDYGPAWFRVLDDGDVCPIAVGGGTRDPMDPQ